MPNSSRQWNEKSKGMKRATIGFSSPSIVGSPQVSFLMCTLEIPQKIAVQVLLLLTLFTFTFEPFLKLSFPQTMSLSCIFVFAPSFIRMDLSIVTSSTSLTFSGSLILFSSISLLFLCIESDLALSSARCHF